MTTKTNTTAREALDAQLVAERKAQAAIGNSAEARIAKAQAKRDRQANRKPQQKKQERRPTHFATRYQKRACQVLVHGSAKAVSEMAKFIAERAQQRGAEVVVVPAQVLENEAAQAALKDAGIWPPKSGSYPQWSADPNFTAEEPERKAPKKGKRDGNGQRPQRKSGYVQPGTGRTKNPYAGMSTAEAKEALAKGKIKPAGK
ncbi:MAG: hypothetical protein VX730_03970 [Pseudomonadota bacterium]|nr:hypothetical protein [Pseudomonadota bacterium]